MYGTADRIEVHPCSACGTGSSLPRVGPEALGPFYPRTYAPYTEPPPGPMRLVSAAIRGWQALLAWRTGPLAAARRRTPGRALDVGCGRGDLAATLHRHGWRADGVEPSPEACAHARARGVEAREGTLATVELEADAYDFVLFHHSLEHTDDPERDLRAVARALRPGGTLVIVCPNFGGWQARRFGSRWYHLDVPRHRTHFTRRGLTALLERLGFRVGRLSTASTPEGLPGSVQYRIWGRCVVRGGLSLRVVTALCALGLPLWRLLDVLAGEGDVLRVEATRA